MIERITVLREAMAKDAKRGAWVAAAFRVDNGEDDHETDVQFEYDDMLRWDIDPDTRQKIVGEFAPAKQ